MKQMKDNFYYASTLELILQTVEIGQSLVHIVYVILYWYTDILCMLAY